MWPLLLLGLVIALGACWALGLVLVPFAEITRGDAGSDAPRERGGAVPDAPQGSTMSLAPAAKIQEGPGPLPDPVDLARVDRDLDLHGVVVTGDSRPVVGARLTTVSHPGRRAA
jgi:hypothetical protein